MLGSSGTSAPGTFLAYVVCDDPATRGNQWTFGTYRGHPR
jgi:hypothetical protein